MADLKQAVKDFETEHSTLIARQKGDEDLLYLDKYIMRDSKDKEVPDIINVTLNRPAVFAANIISALGSTSQQRVVESDEEKFDTTYVEDFQEAAFASANAKLRRQGRPQLNPFFDTGFSIRGRSAARVVFQEIDGVLDTEIIPWDTRGDYVSYAMGSDGLKWAGYKTKRKKDAIEAQYGEELSHFNVSIIGKGGEVQDIWDTEHNEVWVENKKIIEQPHDFGFTPVCIQIVSLGYGTILLGPNSIKNEGESIFFLIRTVIPEYNRLASIMQTLNLVSVKPPMQEAVKEKGRLAKARKHKDITGAGTSNTVDTPGAISKIDFGDAQRSATLASGMFDDAIGEGSLSSADLGRIGSPPASGIRAIIAGENRDQIVMPRLDAKALLNEQIAEMFTRQVIQIGGSVKLGAPGHKRTFEVSKLDGEYQTTYKYTAKSPITDAGLYSLAAAAGSGLSDKYKRENIYQLDDPEGEERQLAIEAARRLSPAIQLDYTIRQLLEAGEDWWAELLSAEMGVNLQQMLAGETAQQPKPEKKDEPTQVLSLFGGGGGGTPRQAGESE